MLILRPLAFPIGVPLAMTAQYAPPPLGTTPADHDPSLLTEGGDALVTESGDRILLEP